MNDIEWVSETDWSKVTVGQKVRLVNADGFVEFEVSCGSGRFSVRSRTTYYSFSGGWSLFVEAPPAVVLPTEPGFYLTSHTYPDVFELFDGKWYWGDVTISVEKVLHDGGKMTRLEPVPETAKKVLDAIKVQYGENFIDNVNESWNRVAREFGVIS